MGESKNAYMILLGKPEGERERETTRKTKTYMGG
jgi:hypothetical protein